MGLGKTYSADYLIDSNGNTGVSGQVLISTATGIDWADGTSIIGGPFLPLSAGVSYPLTGDLYLASASNKGDLFFGTANANYKIFGGGTYGYMGYNTGGYHRFLIDGSEKMRIIGNGNVGIGTTNPLTKLHVDGQDVTFYSNTANQSLQVGRNANERTEIFISDTEHRITAINDADENQAHKFILNRAFSGTGANTFQIQKDGTAQLLIDTNGDVGIGTTSPREKLDVAGNIVTTWGNDRFVGLQFQQGADYRNGLLLHGDNRSTGLIAEGASPGSNPYLWLGVGEGSPTERMRINKDGNVGIGTTTPGRNLHVIGQIALDNAASSPSAGMLITADGTSNKIYSRTANNNSTALAFEIISGASSSLYIKADGNVGIGTTNPGSKLDVQGGMSQFSTTLTNNEDWENSPISINERGQVGATQSADKYAPNLNFHWGGTVSKSLWMGANGHLNWGEYSAAGVPVNPADGRINANFFGGELLGTINTATTGVTQTAGDNSTLIATTAYADAAAAAGGGNFLPLSGGTMTGDITFNNSVRSLKWEYTSGQSASRAYAWQGEQGAYGRFALRSSNAADNVIDTDVLYFDNDLSATFAGIANVSGGVKVTGFTTPTGSGAEMIFTSGSSFFQSYDRVNSVYLPVKIDGSTADLQIGGVPKLSINSSGNATFAGTINSGTITSTGIVKAATTFQATSGDMTFYVTNVGEAMRIQQNTGNVGIGTTDPSKPLEVVGHSKFQAASGGVIFLHREDNTVATGNQLGSVHFGGGIEGVNDYNPSAARIIGLASTHSGSYQWSSTDTASEIQFGTTEAGGTTLATKMTIKHDGNVGIGTTDPSFNFDILDTSSPTFRITRNGATDFRISSSILANGAFLGTYSDAPIQFLTNSTIKAIITSSGNVGIGTTAPGAKLQVAGTTTYNSDTVQTLRVCDAADVSKGIHIGFDTTLNAGVIQAGDFGVAYKSLVLNPNAGNVGIGTTTPNNKLDVNGNVFINSNYTANVGAQDLTIGKTTTGDHGLTIVTGNANTAGIFFADNNNNDAGRIKYQHSSNSMRFDTNRSEAMRITSAGDVGIGTTAPGYALDVISSAANKSARFRNSAGGDTLVRIIAGDYNTEIDARLFIGESDTYGMTFEYDGSANVGYIGMNDNVDPTGAFSKRISMSRAGTEVLFPAGNVGIGTTAPVRKLHIQDTTGNPQLVIGDGASIYSSIQSANSLYINAGDGGGGSATIFRRGTSLTESMRIDSAGAIKFNAYGAGFLQTDASGNITAGTVTTSDTLDDVTDNGNTTTNSITVGSIVSNGTGATAAAPTVAINNSSSETFNHTANLLTANLTADETNALVIGQRTTAKNAGYLGYKFASAGSDSNVLTFGHMGALDLMGLNGLGNLGIGNLGPTQKLHVTGNARVTGAFYDSNNSPGTAGQVLSSTATGTDWVAESGSTVYTPDVFEITTAQSITSQGYLLSMSGTQILDGSTGATIPSGGGNTITATQNGVYEISYTMYLETTHNVRQVIGAYIEKTPSGSQPSQLAGSFSSVYMRIGGSNQGFAGTITNTFYATLAANDAIKIRMGRTDSNTSPTGISIQVPDWPTSGVKHVISLRKINAAS